MKLELDTSSLSEVRAALTMLDALNNFLVARGIEKTAAAIVEEKAGQPGNGHAEPARRLARESKVEEPEGEEPEAELDYKPYDKQVMKNAAEFDERLAELLKMRGRAVTPAVQRERYERTKAVLEGSRPAADEEASEDDETPIQEQSAEALDLLLKGRQEQQAAAAASEPPPVSTPRTEPTAESEPEIVLPKFLTNKQPRMKTVEDLRNDMEKMAQQIENENDSPTALAWWKNAVKQRGYTDILQMNEGDLHYVLEHPTEFMPAV